MAARQLLWPGQRRLALVRPGRRWELNRQNGKAIRNETSVGIFPLLPRKCSCMYPGDLASACVDTEQGAGTELCCAYSLILPGFSSPARLAA